MRADTTVVAAPTMAEGARAARDLGLSPRQVVTHADRLRGLGPSTTVVLVAADRLPTDVTREIGVLERVVGAYVTDERRMRQLHT